MSQNQLKRIPTTKQLQLLEGTVIKLLAQKLGDETVWLHYRYERDQITPRYMRMDVYNYTEDSDYGGSVRLYYSTKNSPEPKSMLKLSIPPNERFCRRIARWRVLRAYYCNVYGF